MPRPKGHIPSLKGESEFMYCHRVAGMYTLEDLAAFGLEVMESRAKARRIPVWSFIARRYGHGRAISMLIEERFRKLIGGEDGSK